MSSSTTVTVPYPPSALNRLFAAIERLPFGGWWVYPLSFLVLLVYISVALWVMGRLPVGSFALDGIRGSVYGPYTLAAAHYFTRVSGRAIDASRPASGLSDAEYARRRYELTTLPAGRLGILLVVGGVIGVGAILSAPPAAISTFGGTRAAAIVAFGPASLFGYGLIAVILYQTARQLRDVERFHREATAIDPFDTAPIYAFSRLTVQIGLGFVFAAYYSLIANPTFQAGNAFSLAVIGTSITVGVVCFIVPLWGIHGRLAPEKAALIQIGRASCRERV